MKEIEKPTLIVICGWPISGKGSVAELVSKSLGIPWIDIDNIRFLNFGPPHPRPNISEETRRVNNDEMRGSYSLLYAATDINLDLGRSLIVTATFSRNKYIDDLPLKNHPGVELKIVWCKPLNDSNEEIERRIGKRVFGVNCWSAVNSLDHYKEVKNRFEPISRPHLEIDTSPPNSVEACAESAIRYIQS